MSRQIRQGIANNTKGTAFVVYEDVMDAKQACDKLNGFNFQSRYLVVLYHQPDKMAKQAQDLQERQEAVSYTHLTLPTKRIARGRLFRTIVALSLLDL